MADRILSLTEALTEKYFTDRYPGFDLEDEDWPALREQVEEVTAPLALVKSRLPTPAPDKSV